MPLIGKVDKVVISDLKNNTFYAHILIKQNGKSIDVDSRPSDAIALALRLDVPIFINEIVLDKVAIGGKPIGEDELAEFRKKLKDLKPEDFGT